MSFPGCGTVIKPDRDKDLYVSWSDIVEAPHGVWTRAEALADGCPPDRLDRADAAGTSSHVPEGKPFYGWDDPDLIAEQRGILPRARLADYAIAYCEDRMEDCWDMLEPFSDDTPVRRG